MTFVEGESLGDIIQRAINAAGLSSASGSSAKAGGGKRIIHVVSTYLHNSSA